MGGTATSISARLTRFPPLFVVGAPRSGTSLVYRALSLHPQAAYMSNWLRRRPGWPALSLLNRLPRFAPGLQNRYWFGPESNAYRYGAPRPLTERLFPAPVEGGPVFEASGIGERDSRPNAEQLARLQAAFAGLTRYGGGATVVSKRITNNRHLELLAEVFPSARFVSIVRDGRAVAYSLSRVNWWQEYQVWWFDGTPQEWEERGGDPWELCARVWVEEVRVIEAGLAGLDPERVLRISYEELVADPLAGLGRIGRFGGLPESGRWNDALRRLQYPNRNEAWRKSLDPELIRRIESVEGPELRRYGYI
ncbi:MAG: sulfotransferase [Candidatus Dormibacteraeota bacterium]|nr:sulfotransferase [Candidatus Dormibacteraeota bacterium]